MLTSPPSRVSVRGYVVTSERFWRVFFKRDGWTAPRVPGPPRCRFTITLRRSTFGSTVQGEKSACRRDLYLITRLTKDRHIHAPGRIRTRIASKWAAADPRLRPIGHRDQQIQRTLFVLQQEMVLFFTPKWLINLSLLVLSVRAFRFNTTSSVFLPSVSVPQGCYNRQWLFHCTALSDHSDSSLTIFLVGYELHLYM